MVSILRESDGHRDGDKTVVELCPAHGISDVAFYLWRRKFGKVTKEVGIKLVRSRVRAPYLDGKIERFFRTFKLWKWLILTGNKPRHRQPLRTSAPPFSRGA